MSNEYKDWVNDLKNAPEHSPEHNEYLCMEYPFLIPRNRWTGEIVEDFDFSYTELDDVEEGWRTLCLNLCEEIKQELLKYEGALDKYRITQIKEKYGYLRWYDNGAPVGSKIYEIISKYEEMSKRICGKCGAPATRISTGWYYPFCEDCIPTHNGQKIYTVDIEEFYKEDQNNLLSTSFDRIFNSYEEIAEAFPINGKDEYCYFAEEKGLIEKVPMYYRYFSYTDGTYELLMNPHIFYIITKNEGVFKYPIIFNFRGKNCGYFRTEEEAINFTKEGIKTNGD